MARMYGKVHVAGKNSKGENVYSRYPQTKESAIEQNIARYDPFPKEFCPRCRSQFIIYTKTDIRSCCSINDAATAYRNAVANGEPTEPTEGFKYYWNPSPHKQCGHVGKTTLDGKCFTCKEDRMTRTKALSPRQIALQNGDVWYLPEPGDLCSQGHYAERRVNNGSCRQCELSRVTTKPHNIEEMPPDTIIDRATAKALGFTHYRTGKPCRYGHTGFRYVSTDACLDCKKER